MRTLFDETKINSMTLKNRLIRSATWENMADQSGHMTDSLFKLYEGLACGGVGLIVTGYAFPLAEEQPNPGMMGIYDDSFIEDYRPLTEMVHSHGSRIVMQLAYGGSQTNYRTEDRNIWGPSEVADLAFKVVPHEMSRENIQTLINAYGDAATRAKAAGFDGVQLHSAHGYLLKESAGIEVIAAVRVVHANHRYLSQKISDSLVDEFASRARISFCRAVMIASISNESVPPLVSHNTMKSAPPSSAADSVSNAYALLFL